MPHYDWVWGNPPPPLKRHSEVKHALLRNYLIEYFLTLVSLPQQDKIRLTIVDGFCGGGFYVNQDGKEVPGSPLVILEAIREAEARINLRQERRKPIRIDVELICIDDSKMSLLYLEHLLEARGYGEALRNGNVRLVQGKFADHCAAAVQRSSDRSRNSGRALFVLDQYGYSAVPMHCLREIFARLKHAEVLLTFYIDSLISYLNEQNPLRASKSQSASPLRCGLPTWMKSSSRRDGVFSCNPRCTRASRVSVRPSSSRRSSFDLSEDMVTSGCCTCRNIGRPAM